MRPELGYPVLVSTNRLALEAPAGLTRVRSRSVFSCLATFFAATHFLTPAWKRSIVKVPAWTGSGGVRGETVRRSFFHQRTDGSVQR
jgi:hypothetical protein